MGADAREAAARSKAVPPYSERVKAILEAQHAVKQSSAPVPAPAPPQLPPALVGPFTPYTPEGMVDTIIQNPELTPKQLAALYGKTAGWFATVVASEAFQQALEPRRAEVADPAIVATMEERLKALAIRGLEVLQQKLDSPAVSDIIVLKAAEIGVKGLGLGALPPPVTSPLASGPEAVANRIMEAMAAAKARTNSAAVDVPSREVPANGG